MFTRFLTYCNEKKLLKPNTRVLVAISGGADSVCLAHVLTKGGWYVEFAHCNFGLRGDESDGDELFVRQFAQKLSVICHVVSFDTNNYAHEKGVSIEMAARELRYEWFAKLLCDRQLDCVAVAHNQNDSIETLFINLTRGTGIKGLCGIKPQNGSVVRPLLFASRQEIEAYCAENDLLFRVDSSNLSNDYVRNVFRNQILPQIREINPSLQASVATTIDHLNEVEALYSQAVEVHKQRIVTPCGNDLQLSCCALRDCLQKRTLLFEILQPYGFQSAQIDDIVLAIDAQAGKRFFSPQAVLTKDRDVFILSKHDSSFPLYEIDLLLGTNVYGNETFMIELYDKSNNSIIEKDANITYIDSDTIALPLRMRVWQKGDCMLPFGMNGKRKKISDLLVDNKIPLYRKVQQLVVCDAKGSIIWLVGLRSAHNCQIRPETKRVIQIRRIEN